MNFINFPESNKVMGAGGNENTHAIRVLVSEHPEYKKGTRFYAAKFEFDGNERYKIAAAIKDRVREKLGRDLDAETLECIKEALPNLWLNCMHGFMPTLLTVDPPWANGYRRIVFEPQPRDN